MVKNDIFTFLQIYPLELIWHFYISTVRDHVGRSIPPVEASSGQEWHFHISTLELILADQLADLYAPW